MSKTRKHSIHNQWRKVSVQKAKQSKERPNLKLVFILATKGLYCDLLIFNELLNKTRKKHKNQMSKGFMSEFVVGTISRQHIFK